MANRIGVNRRTALMMFWNAGWNTEALLRRAAELLDGLALAAAGIYYADDVAALIERN